MSNDDLRARVEECIQHAKIFLDNAEKAETKSLTNYWLWQVEQTIAAAQSLNSKL